MALRKIKGQNFRALVGGKAVRSATNCSVQITGNAEDASHKDVDHNFSTEQIVSKSWNVSVDSVNADVAMLKALLNRIKDGEPLQVGFDHTTGAMNRTPAGADFSRQGLALLTDLSIQADNRTTISLSEQYLGTGPLGKGMTSIVQDTTEGKQDKGQHLRLFISRNTGTTMTEEAAIALATSLTFHVGVQTEDSTTKDSTDGDGGLWQENEATSMAYDIQIGAMVGIKGGSIGDSSKAENGLNEMIESVSDNIVQWTLAVVSGEQNRTIDAVVATGRGKLTNVSATGQNRQNATYTATLNGYGPYDVPEDE